MLRRYRTPSHLLNNTLSMLNNMMLPDNYKRRLKSQIYDMYNLIVNDYVHMNRYKKVKISSDRTKKKLQELKEELSRYKSGHKILAKHKIDFMKVDRALSKKL